MAKLERVTAKVFASDAPADKIGQFGSALAGTKLETGDVSTIQALPAYTEGWSSAVISQRNYPVLQETNGVMKNMSYQTAYIMQNGIAEYDPDTEYYTGSICKGIGNTNQYASWGDENVGNAVTNSDYWKNVTPVNYSNITNCLLEVPQRIKLELNNGTLTLKAGSEVIVPNGFEADGTTPKFDYILTESDTTIGTVGTVTGETFLLWNTDKKQLAISYHTSSQSGSSVPSTFSGVFYDTTNNTMAEYQNGVTVKPSLSLPFALCIRETGVLTSINQVFNGMGYFGSTVWVDKGVKGLIPNGRNEDGSLNNIEWVNNKIRTTGADATGNFYVAYQLDIDNFGIKAPASWVFDENENMFVYKDGIEHTLLILSNVNLDAGVITSFTPKQPFRAVDYNEFANTPHITETYVNGTSWYRVWSDGWIEQGGRVSLGNGANTTIKLLKNFSNTNYGALGIGSHTASVGACFIYDKTTSSFVFKNSANTSSDTTWYAYGY